MLLLDNLAYNIFSSVKHCKQVNIFIYVQLSRVFYEPQMLFLDFWNIFNISSYLKPRGQISFF